LLTASPLLTPAEVARILNATPFSVRRWVQSGELEAIRLGSGPNARYRIPEDAVEKFVRATGKAVVA
jgi:excisionase family DNA binding protein